MSTPDARRPAGAPEGTTEATGPPGVASNPLTSQTASWWPHDVRRTHATTSPVDHFERARAATIRMRRQTLRMPRSRGAWVTEILILDWLLRETEWADPDTIAEIVRGVRAGMRAGAQ